MHKTLPLAIALAAGLAGCATTGPADPRDPLEGFNRGVYKVNDTLDRNVMKPIAQGYVKVVPGPVRTCVSNVFANVGDVWSAFNMFLQNRAPDGIKTTMRVMLNTTMGVGGCFDIAAMQGEPRKQADFGQTLGVWGIGPGPFVMLPLFGPSTVRDTGGFAVDHFGNPLTISTIDDVPLRNSLYGVDFVNTRARYLDAGNLLNDVALDPYAFMRDAYLQRRAAVIREGRGEAGGDEALPDYGDDEDEDAAAPAPSAK